MNFDDFWKQLQHSVNGLRDESAAMPDIDDPTDAELYENAKELVSEASRLHMTLGTAESCTGGLVAGAVTAVPGSSEVIRGGVVSYAIAVKHEVLGVSNGILDAPGVGAVSSECAEQMCLGACRVLGSDIAVSVTGIAGPGGAEPGKPVGTVWFGVGDVRPREKGVLPGAGSYTQCRLFSGDRATVRRKAVMVALLLLRFWLRMVEYRETPLG